MATFLDRELFAVAGTTGFMSQAAQAGRLTRGRDTDPLQHHSHMSISQ